MNDPRRYARTRWQRLTVYGLLFWLALAVAAPLQQAHAQPTVPGVEAAPTQPVEEDGFFWAILKNLFNSRELMKVLEKPQYTLLAVG